MVTSCWYHVPLIWRDEKGTSRPWSSFPNLTTAVQSWAKHHTNSYWGTFLQIIWLVILTNVKVTKNKASLRNCHRPEETEATTQLSVLWYPGTLEQEEGVSRKADETQKSGILVNVGFFILPNVPWLCKILTNVGAVWWIYGNSLYHLCSFSVNKKLFRNKCLF